MTKPGRVLLPQVKVLCPLTGQLFGSKQVDAHHCNATLAVNGSVHIYCPMHLFKGFISHPQILEAWNVAKALKESSVRPVK
jgi:hypothetical protein